MYQLEQEDFFEMSSWLKPERGRSVGLVGSSTGGMKRAGNIFPINYNNLITLEGLLVLGD